MEDEMFEVAELPRSLQRHPDAPATILKLLRNGTFPTAACAYAGIPYSSFQKALSEGARLYGLWEDDKDFEATEVQVVLMELFTETNRAVALAENQLAGVVHDAALHDDDWKAAAWMLEHRFKENWRPSKEVSVSTTTEITLVERRATVDDLLASLHDKLQEQEALGAGDVQEAEVIPATSSGSTS